MAKFNVIQKQRRAAISAHKRAVYGDPNTRKLKIRRQKVPLSGKQKRKIFRRWRREQKDALQKGVVDMAGIEMTVSEGACVSRVNMESSSTDTPLMFRVKKRGKFARKKMKAKDCSNMGIYEQAAHSSVDAMEE